MPVELPTLFEFVINLKTAATLGLKILASVLLRATEFDPAKCARMNPGYETDS